MKVLLVDNYDSFTYMLKDYIEQCGVVCIVKRNDDETIWNAIDKCDALVLSPGPKRPESAGLLMQILNKYYTTKPILGVCLGHQAIGLFFGANLVNALKPMHGKIATITHFKHAIFNKISEHFMATRYHSLILKNIPQTLEAIAITEQGEVMGIAHPSLPIIGIQFHPESCTTVVGLTIIKNFLSVVYQNQ